MRSSTWLSTRLGTTRVNTRRGRTTVDPSRITDDPLSTARCYLPIHVYDTDTGRPVVVILRPGKTPSGAEVRKLLSRLVGRIRRHWPDTHITLRGDSHYGREEAMTWCENNGVDYLFGLPGNVVLDRLVEPVADDKGCTLFGIGN